MPEYFWTILMIIFAIFTIIWLTRGIWMSKGRTYGIEQEEMERLVREEGATIIDVRTPKEYARGHIPGAAFVQAETAKQKFPGLFPDKKKPYILYCASGMRSGIVVDHLKELGYENLHDFKGIKRYQGELER